MLRRLAFPCLANLRQGSSCLGREEKATGGSQRLAGPPHPREAGCPLGKRCVPSPPRPESWACLRSTAPCHGLVPDRGAGAEAGTGPGPELSTVPDAGVQKPGFSASLCASPGRPSGIPSQRPGQKRVKSPGLPGRGGGAGGCAGLTRGTCWETGKLTSGARSLPLLPAQTADAVAAGKSERFAGARLCNRAPQPPPTRPRGIAPGWRGAWGRGGPTEAASSPQTRSGLAASHYFPGPLVPFCRFVNLRGLELGAAPLGRSLAAGVLVPRVALGRGGAANPGWVWGAALRPASPGASR